MATTEVNLNVNAHTWITCGVCSSHFYGSVEECVEMFNKHTHKLA